MVTKLEIQKEEKLLYRCTYTYDEKGNCIRMLIEGGLQTEENGEWIYGYDALDRLCSITKDGTKTAEYAYDPWGNRIWSREEGKETYCTYDRADRLIERRSGEERWNYAYDRRGNLTEIIHNGQQQAVYIYDGRGNLIRKEEPDRITAYTYDALNHRIQKEVSGKKEKEIINYRHDATRAIHTLCAIEKNGKASILVYGEEGTLEQIREEETTRYFLTDENGTPILSLNESGEILQTYCYDAFGREKKPCGEAVGYAGYIREDKDLWLAGCRYYDAELGRFQSRDRLGGKLLDIQSQNRYAYVRNNPLTYTDPDGLSPVQSGASSYLTGNHTQTGTMPYAAALQEDSGQITVDLGCRAVCDYVEKSLNQAIFGNFTDDVTLLGMGLQVLTGIAGVDLPMDIRDIIADFTNWEWSFGHVATTFIDVLGVVPVVGVIKYADELFILGKNGVKSVLKYTDEAWDSLKASTKAIREWDIYKSIKNFFTGGGEKAVKEAGVLDDVVESGKYSVFGGMSEAEGRRYQEFLKNGSIEGLTEAEQKVLAKVDAQAAFNKVNSDDILKLRINENSTKDGIGSAYSGEAWYNYYVDKYRQENVQGTFFNEIKYEPTSGVKFTTQEGKTTTILGRYDMDTKSIFSETGNIKSISYDGHDGGFNLLNIPDELSEADGVDFWNDYNVPFLDEVIGRKDIIQLATEPNQASMFKISTSSGLLERSGFGREILYLEEHGYKFDKTLMQMVPLD